MPPFDRFPTRRARPREAARALAAALLALAALALLLTTAPAHGDDPPPPVPISAGAGLDWGIKQSFRTYVEGAIALGTITVSDGATRNSDGTFHFPLSGGSFDPATNTTIVQLVGTVHMVGHGGALDMSVSNPRVELTPTQSRLLADVVSRPLDGGDPVPLADAQFATLPLDGVDPVVDSGTGTTTWGAIPARLAPDAVPAFAGHYSVGTDLDPLSLSYDGPGGKPIPPLEQWSEPGAPVFGVVAHQLLDGLGVGALVPDPAHGVVHAVGRLRADSGTAYRALDADSLDVVAQRDDATQTWRGAGQLVITRRAALAGDTLFVTSFAGPLLRTRLTDEGYVSDPAIGSAAPSSSTPPTHVAVAPGGTRLYVSGGNATAPWARTYTLADGTWSEQVYAFDATRGATTDLAVDGDGAVLETHGAGTLGTRGVGILDFATSPLVRTEIPDTVVTGANGLARLAVAPGVAYAAEYNGATSRVQRLAKGSSGYAVDGPLLQTNATLRAIAADASDGTLYAGTWDAVDGQLDGRVLAIRDGAIVGSVTLSEAADVLATAAGTVYVSGDTGNVWAIRQLGVTPAITHEPEDVTIALAGDEPSHGVTFTAAASGDPAPSVRWQSRAPGSTLFADVPGATSTTLELDATVADDGTQYRAVFANETAGDDPQAVGRLATDPATLTVKAAPSVLVQPADVSVVEGGSALLKVLSGGNPLPTVQWQRLDGGTWTDMPGATDGFLSIPAATLALDGTRYRALLTNELGSATTRAARLTVAPTLPETVTFGSGHLDWGVKASFRTYVEGPIAHGSYTAADGATRNPDGTIRFELLGGTYRPAERTGELQLRGTVRFTGHDAGSGPQLDLTLRDPRLVLAGDVATLRAAATSRALVGGALQQFPDVALASLDLTGTSPAPLLDGLAWDALPATLTAAAVPVFEQYAAGTAMDPLSVAAQYGTPRQAPGAEPPPAASGGVDPPAVPGAAAVAARHGAIVLAGARRTATIAVVTCRRGPCRIGTPRRAHVRIGGRTFRAVVLAPRTLASGRRAAVRIRLTRRAAARLGCRRAAIRLRISVAGTGARTSDVVAVVLRRPRGSCASA